MTRQQQLLFMFVPAEWVVSYKNSSSVFPQPKKRLCQSEWICLPKVGLKGIQSQHAVGVCGANRLQQAANIRHNSAWHSAEATFKRKKEKIVAQEEKNYKSELAVKQPVKAKDANNKSTYFICYVCLLIALNGSYK